MLEQEGYTWRDIQYVILTHGHLDHTYNISAIVELSGAVVYAHPLDADHITGEYDYSESGLGFVCGILECFGRGLFLYKKPKIDHWLRDGQELPIWGGLRVVHLPGHTIGHCGFYSEKHELLFAGDLFATCFGKIISPWAFFNACPQYLDESFERVYALQPKRILLNHSDTSSAEAQASKFKIFMEKR